MKPKTIEKDYGREQAESQLESIKEMVKALEKSERGKIGLDFSSDEYEDAEQTIQEHALSVEVRDDWYVPGESLEKAVEYKILLCTGGPAVRIIGTLDRGAPDRAILEYQDWFTPWTEYRITADDEKVLLRYAQCFYFGE